MIQVILNEDGMGYSFAWVPDVPTCACGGPEYVVIENPDGASIVLCKVCYETNLQPKQLTMEAGK
jgi:hypothetical protein